MKMEIKNVTPALAKKLLDANEKNRNVSRQTVSGYARDMAAGKWQMNGAAIVIAKSGELLDGQHRLLACLESGVPFATYVCSDADESARTTIDSGRVRTAGDRLQMNGVKNANVTAAAISILASVAGDLATPRITPTELEEILNAHPGIVESAHTCSGVKYRVSAIMTALHYIGCYHGRKMEADAFIETIKSGIGYGHGDPAFTIREKLIKDSMSSIRMTRPILIKTCISSFRKYMAGEPSQVARAQGDFKIPGWNADDLRFGKNQEPGLAAE